MATTDQSYAADEPYEFYIEPGAHGSDEHHEPGTMLGFWLYLMSDCLIFGILFAVYAVLGTNYAAGPSPADLFEIEAILLSTVFLLLSSITYGFAVINMQQRNQGGMTVWLLVTLAFGLGFLFMELREFSHLWHIGAGPGQAPSCRPSGCWWARMACM